MKTHKKNSETKNEKDHPPDLTVIVSSLFKSLQQSDSAKSIRIIASSAAQIITIFAALTAIVFFWVWLREAPSRKEENLLRSYDLELKSHQMLRDARINAAEVSYDTALKFILEKELQEMLCHVNVTGLLVKGGNLSYDNDGFSCLFTVGEQSILSELSILNGSLRLYASEKYYNEDHVAEFDAITDYYNATGYQSPVAELSRAFIKGSHIINADLVNISNSILLNISSDLKNLTMEDSVLGGTSLVLNSANLSTTMLYDAELEFQSYNVHPIILRDVVLIDTKIRFKPRCDPYSPEHCDITLNGAVNLINVCKLGDTEIEGIEVPDCIFPDEETTTRFFQAFGTLKKSTPTIEKSEATATARNLRMLSNKSVVRHDFWNFIPFAPLCSDSVWKISYDFSDSEFTSEEISSHTYYSKPRHTKTRGFSPMAQEIERCLRSKKLTCDSQEGPIYSLEYFNSCKYEDGTKFVQKFPHPYTEISKIYPSFVEMYDKANPIMEDEQLFQFEPGNQKLQDPLSRP